MGRHNWDTSGGTTPSSGVSSNYPSSQYSKASASKPSSVASSVNSDYLELETGIDDNPKPIKRKSCWDRCCPCLQCCCPCIPWWAQCFVFTLIVLGATFGIIALIIGPITSSLINNSDPNKVKIEGLNINFPDEGMWFNITFDLKLLDPSPISADLQNTTAQMWLVKSDGTQEELAEIPLPHIHITPGTNTTIKIDVFKVKIIKLWNLVDALEEALDVGSIKINTKANLTIDTPWWPLHIYANMDKTMPPISSFSIGNLPPL